MSSDYIIRHVQDVIALKNVRRESLTSITVDSEHIYNSGLLRHICKYAFFKLQLHGILHVRSKPLVSYASSNHRVDFWQIRLEVFTCCYDNFTALETDNNAGIIKLKKVKVYEPPTGISYGIVYSGNEVEKIQLLACIESIYTTQKNAGDFEIIICASPGASMDFLWEQPRNENIKVSFQDIVSPSGRILICKKKNLLFNQAMYSICVICHTRILFSEPFAREITSSDFELCTPAVYFKQGASFEKYLDYLLIDSYTLLAKKQAGNIIAGQFINKDYWYWFSTKVPSIDGGLNIFNKNIITGPPYNNAIAWGEAEDVEMCARLYHQGILIDYFFDIVCYSTTNKLTGKARVVKKYYRKVITSLKKKGLIKY